MQYLCTNCEGKFLGWSGKCPNCGAWGTLEEDFTQEETKAAKANKNSRQTPGRTYKVTELSSSELDNSRVSTGFREFDRVLGGGFISGEAVLVSGEPGIGKSTLLLQVAINLSRTRKVLYVTGEESLTQVKSRFDRIVNGMVGGMGAQEVAPKVKVLKPTVKMAKSQATPDKLYNPDNMVFAEEVDLDSILDMIEQEKPGFVVVDSIQSVNSVESKGFPGSMSQVRICGTRLVRKAKELGIPTVIVGQITKEGTIAGPKILEHTVDCVIYIEGEEYNMYRVVRGMKNRFGATNEIGVFEMHEKGMLEVENPSQIFLENVISVPGCAIGAVLKGSRVVFVEVQALTVERDSEGGPLRRVANGIKKPRLDMLCAVLTRHGDVYLGDRDVFVNIVGGLTVDDPMVDLAVCAAIKSSVKDKVTDASSVFVGEVGLTGEIRNFLGFDSVAKEAGRLGYKILFAPSSGKAPRGAALKVVSPKGVRGL
jgi:DNA repair protein RadA/Sms